MWSGARARRADVPRHRLEEMEADAPAPAPAGSGEHADASASETKMPWQTDERSYIFEERLAKGEEHKKVGNEHFRHGEWGAALRRYERALYHACLDEAQQFDLMDKHRDDLAAVLVPLMLNYVACVLKVRECAVDAEPAKLEGEDEEVPLEPLGRCEEVLKKVLKMDPKCAKAHYRRGQVLIARGDLRAADEALARAEKLAGGGGGVREAQRRVRELQREERARERTMFGAVIQKSSDYREAEALSARRAARRSMLLRTARALAFPLAWPAERLWAVVVACIRWMRELGRARRPAAPPEHTHGE